MNKTGAEIKAKLLAEYEAILDDLLRQADESPPPTLSEIEEFALGARAEVGVQVTSALLEKRSGQSLPGPCCERCGQEMHYKGRKHHYLRTRSGEVALERAYYYCEVCRQGVFPPR